MRLLEHIGIKFPQQLFNICRMWGFHLSASRIRSNVIYPLTVLSGSVYAGAQGVICMPFYYTKFIGQTKNPATL